MCGERSKCVVWMPLSSDALRHEEFFIGVASAVGCGLIVLTYLFFPNLRKLRYVELVFYVGVNDLMSSIGLALGPSPNGSVECWYQGLSSNGNILSAMFWTNIITYQVYHVVVNKGSVLKDMFYIHCICWGLPWILTFVPLSTSTYGNPDDEETWCFVADTSYSPPWSELFWAITSFYAWVWIAMLWSLYMIVSIALKLRKMQIVPDVVQATIGKLVLYPVIITVCWTLNTAANLYIFSTGKAYTDLNNSWSLVANLGVATATSQGFLNACVFFGTNPLVREHWASLFCDLYFNICCCNCGAAQAGSGSEKDQILADLEAARSSSNLSTPDSITRLNTLQNSVAGIGTHPTIAAGNILPQNRGASMNSNSSGARGGSSISVGSSLHSSAHVRGLKLVTALEQQADYIGDASLPYTGHRTVGITPNTAGASSSGGGDDGRDAAEEAGVGGVDNGAEVHDVSRESAFLSSVESAGAPVTAFLHGIQRTASGEFIYSFIYIF